MKSFCKCNESEKHGQTSVMCCNHCGLPDEDFWQQPHCESPSPKEGETLYTKQMLFRIVTDFVEDACINHEKRGKETMPEWRERFNKTMESYHLIKKA